MIPVKAYAVQDAASPLTPWQFERRAPRPHDVVIEILYCGVCHTDIHFARNEWGFSIYPMVPGHEIVGRVIDVGKDVKKFDRGDMAGVGCLVDSCRECSNCKDGLEQYCIGGGVFTYNGIDKEDKTNTYGGYSSKIVVDEKYVLKVSHNADLEKVAPLLCAGITTYSPLRHWKVGKGHRVAVLGLGGLGHMAVKFAHSFGAEVTVLSTSKSKEADAKYLGADYFVLTSDDDQVAKATAAFDFIIDTVSAPHDYNMYLSMLKTNGVMILLGVPVEDVKFPPGAVIFGRKSMAGSLIGGLPETQEMLDYCARHNITSDVEVIPIQEINTAYERMLKGDVKYRFVIDMASL